MKIKTLSMFLLCVCLFCGCGDAAKTPLNVVIKDQSYLYSDMSSITVVYAEDKRLRDKFTDVYVMADQENLSFKLAKELGEFWDIEILEPNKWLSLSSLVDYRFVPAKFSKVETTTFVLTSQTPCSLKFKVVGGDLEYNCKNGTSKVVNTFDVSKPLDINLN